MSIKSLIINPGSTSTKIGVFEDETLLFEETLRHSTEEIAQYASIVDQKDFRKQIILDLLAKKNFDINSLQVIVGRGGMLKPIPGGTYAVSDELLEDLKIGKQGQHASNLGGILAREIGDSIGVPSFIVDPVVVDELIPTSRYSGVPELPRTSVFHALNQKAVAKRYAKEIGKPYDSLNLIVVHMGGGVSVGAAGGGGGLNGPAAQFQVQTNPPNIVPTAQQAAQLNSSVFADTDTQTYHQLFNGRQYYQNQNLNIDQQIATISYLADQPEPGSLYSPSQNMNWNRANVAMIMSMRRRIAMRETRIMRGSDIIITTHA